MIFRTFKHQNNDMHTNVKVETEGCWAGVVKHELEKQLKSGQRVLCM
jgi:hypothetical protein